VQECITEGMVFSIGIKLYFYGLLLGTKRAD